jgi:hypothetical protein
LLPEICLPLNGWISFKMLGLLTDIYLYIGRLNYIGSKSI